VGWYWQRPSRYVHWRTDIWLGGRSVRRASCATDDLSRICQCAWRLRRAFWKESSFATNNNNATYSLLFWVKGHLGGGGGAHGGGWVLFFGNFRPRKKSTYSRFVVPRRTASNDPTDLVVVFVCGRTRDPEVSYPTDLPSGYKAGPECRKNSKCTYDVCGIGSKWPNMVFSTLRMPGRCVRELSRDI
jgi:hypothetical protein